MNKEGRGGRLPPPLPPILSTTALHAAFFLPHTGQDPKNAAHGEFKHCFSPPHFTFLAVIPLSPGGRTPRTLRTRSSSARRGRWCGCPPTSWWGRSTST